MIASANVPTPRTTGFVVCTSGAPPIFLFPEERPAPDDPAYSGGSYPTPFARCGAITNAHTLFFTTVKGNKLDVSNVAEMYACETKQHEGSLPGLSGGPVYKVGVAYCTISAAEKEDPCKVYFYSATAAEHAPHVHVLAFPSS